MGVCPLRVVRPFSNFTGEFSSLWCSKMLCRNDGAIPFLENPFFGWWYPFRYLNGTGSGVERLIAGGPPLGEGVAECGLTLWLIPFRCDTLAVSCLFSWVKPRGNGAQLLSGGAATGCGFRSLKVTILALEFASCWLFRTLTSPPSSSSFFTTPIPTSRPEPMKELLYTGGWECWIVVGKTSLSTGLTSMPGILVCGGSFKR